MVPNYHDNCENGQIGFVTHLWLYTPIISSEDKIVCIYIVYICKQYGYLVNNHKKDNWVATHCLSVYANCIYQKTKTLKHKLWHQWKWTNVNGDKLSSVYKPCIFQNKNSVQNLIHVLLDPRWNFFYLLKLYNAENLIAVYDNCQNGPSMSHDLSFLCLHIHQNSKLRGKVVVGI